MDRGKIIAGKLRKTSTFVIPTMFDGDYFKEYHNLQYNDCKSDSMNDTVVLKEDCVHEK